MDEQVEITEFKKRSKDNLYEGERFMFTKAELAKIMDGALYKGHEINMDCVSLGCKEWKNPLIELIPVEDEDV